MHKCPICENDCDCERAEEILKKNPDLFAEDLDPIDCDCECDGDDEED